MKSMQCEAAEVKEANKAKLQEVRGWCKGNLTILRRILHLDLAKRNPK
jgi:hypothetical protein